MYITNYSCPSTTPLINSHKSAYNYFNESEVCSQDNSWRQMALSTISTFPCLKHPSFFLNVFHSSTKNFLSTTKVVRPLNCIPSSVIYEPEVSRRRANYKPNIWDHDLLQSLRSDYQVRVCKFNGLCHHHLISLFILCIFSLRCFHVTCAGSFRKILAGFWLTWAKVGLIVPQCN